MPKPTPDQIRDAGRQLQRGGLLGRGSTKKADQVVAPGRGSRTRRPGSRLPDPRRRRRVRAPPLGPMTKTYPFTVAVSDGKNRNRTATHIKLT
jgi:hypothetical protein